MEIELRRAKQAASSGVHSYYTPLLEENIPYISDNATPTRGQEENFVGGLIDGSGELLLAFDGENVIGMLSIQGSVHYQGNHRIAIGISIQKE